MEFTCTDCNTTSKADISFDATAFVCPACQRSFVKKDSGFVISGKMGNPSISTYLQLGDKGVLNGEQWVVSGIVHKRVYATFYWDEYVLNNAKGELRYLSETDGHFILLREIPDDFKKNKQKVIEFQGDTFRLYDRTEAEIMSAKGFFDEEVSDAKSQMAEYICGSHMLSFETIGGERRVYFGQHISRAHIKRAFPDTPLPSKTGIGLVQPFPLKVRALGFVLAAVGILICFTHFFIYRTQHETVVLNSELRFDAYDGRELVTPSFLLEGGSAPLTVSVSSNVDNSWANVNVTLVDEATNDEISANKDIEYYHGYTDGESWTEGSTAESFNICGVAGGKYHLLVSPMRAPENPSNETMSVRATWNTPSTRNLWFSILFMAAVMIAAYYAQVHFERKRWQDSDFSPFE